MGADAFKRRGFTPLGYTTPAPRLWVLNVQNLLDGRFTDVMVVVTWLRLIMRVYMEYEHRTRWIGGLVVDLAGAVRTTVHKEKILT